VISSATMMSSLRTRAVNDIDTMFKNSFSKRTSDMIMIAAPVSMSISVNKIVKETLTLIQTDHEPLKECLV
jgi:hypothetical protein